MACWRSSARRGGLFQPKQYLEVGRVGDRAYLSVVALSRHGGSGQQSPVHLKMSYDRSYSHTSSLGRKYSATPVSHAKGLELWGTEKGLTPLFVPVESPSILFDKLIETGGNGSV